MSDLLAQLRGPLGPERLIEANINRENEAGVIDAYRELMRSHEGGASGLVVVENDIAEYPELRLDVVGIRRLEVDVDIDSIRALSAFIYRHASDVEEQYLGHPDILRSVLDELLAGRNVSTLYDHPQLINTLIGGNALFGALSTIAEKDFGIDQLALPQRGIIGKGITVLKTTDSEIPAARGVAAAWDTFIGIPRSRKTDTSPVLRKVARRVNIAMLRAFTQPTEEPADIGSIDHIAPSGTSDVVKTTGGKTVVHMGPTNKATGKIVISNTILPAGVMLGDSEPIVTLGEPTTITGPDDIHEVMAGIAERNTLATGIEHVYHDNQDSFAAATE